MIRAHKIRLNPTPAHEVYFRKAAGTARFVYNWALARWQDTHHTSAQGPSPLELKRQFNSLKGEQFPWVYEVAKDVAEGAFFNLSAALKNYQDSKEGKRKGEKIGLPRFKSKKRSKLSFRLNNDKFIVRGHHLYVPKLGWVNMAEALRFQGKILGAVVSKVIDRWFVSIQVDIAKPQPVQFTHASIGIDLGLKTLATLSDGAAFENQKLLRSDLTTLRKLNRSLSRRQQGSHRWKKAQGKLGRFHKRIADRRNDLIHKMTTTIAMTYRIIGVEDLHIKGMGKYRRLALALSDASLGTILRQLVYKAEHYGGQVVQVGRFFASSKMCSACGHVNKSLTLSVRQWTCQCCGVSHDRDWNASKNIELRSIASRG